MQKFDRLYLPMPYSLKNNGVLCYFNSLVQSLMSCTALTKHVLEMPETSNGDSEITREYANIIRSVLIRKADASTLYDVSFLLNSLVNFRKSLKNNLSVKNQEDVQEGLTLLLDSMNPSISDLFHIRYKCEIVCHKCGVRKM